MRDIRLDDGWDISISGETGDVEMASSPIQEAMIRLRWFFAEWVFNDTLGVPYFEHVFVKNPNLEYIKALLKEEILKVEGVLAVTGLSLHFDRARRAAIVSFAVKTDEGTFRREVDLHG